MSAFFIVRAVVQDQDTRDDFDRWYQQEHLPDALQAFGCRRGWRGWNSVDPLVHTAFYEFDTLQEVEALPESKALKGMIAEFDRLWDGRATRTREIVAIAQTLTGAAGPS